jgi:peptidylprolyl isomerase
MPTSKQARARQNRQKDRVAQQHAQRQRAQRRRRIWAAVVAAVLVAIMAIGAAAIVSTEDKNRSGTRTPETADRSATTTTTLPPQKKCVGLKDKVPQGVPEIPIKAKLSSQTLVTKDLVTGTGEEVQPGAKVLMRYAGVACTTGKIFEQNFAGANSEAFPADLSPAGNLIEGWQQGIPGMKIGGIRLLEIPSNLAYKEGGQGASIGPNEPLFFVVKAEKLNG